LGIAERVSQGALQRSNWEKILWSPRIAIRRRRKLRQEPRRKIGSLTTKIEARASGHFNAH
jgi:hypothetical protein